VLLDDVYHGDENIIEKVSAVIVSYRTMT